MITLLGSLGLFLLGMWLLTEGLKLAGGRALSRLLSRWTEGRLRALFSGVTITAIVQSSSAVTVATVGFVNAGLLGLERAMWVVFGSNVGTTLTTWIVSFFGFSFKIGSYTFGLIGIGAGLRMFSPSERWKNIGTAMAGFGLLFMGISELQEAFSGITDGVDVDHVLANSGFPTLSALVIGFVLTLLTQSSTASIAIILTAVAGGIAGIEAAAAAVIGASIGTTSTAVIASFGATPNAKRVASAHVAFNVIAGAVALVLLPLYPALVPEEVAAETLPIYVAIFHTAFKLTGVLIMWPLEARLIAFLMKRFEGKPRRLTSQLDNSLASMPDLALPALREELHELLKFMQQLRLPPNVNASTETTLRELRIRLDHVNNFIALSAKPHLTEGQGELLSIGLSASHHLGYAASRYEEGAEKFAEIENSPLRYSHSLSQWFTLANEISEQVPDGDAERLRENLRALSDGYRDVKKHLLRKLTGKVIPVRDIDLALQLASLSRRYLEQVLQAHEAFENLSFGLQNNQEEAPSPSLSLEESLKEQTVDA